jgi:hypothetical protein
VFALPVGVVRTRVVLGVVTAVVRGLVIGVISVGRPRGSVVGVVSEVKGVVSAPPSIV